jgi:hypothetical protein
VEIEQTSQRSDIVACNLYHVLSLDNILEGVFVDVDTADGGVVRNIGAGVA